MIKDNLLNNIPEYINSNYDIFTFEKIIIIID